MEIYKSGDIVGVKGGFLAVLASHIFAPATQLYHFLVIRSRLEEEDDYEIIEMTQHTCTIGRLSWYDNKSYIVFELADPRALELGKKAAKYASKFGRRKYDYGVFFKLPLDLLWCWMKQLATEHHIRRIQSDELKFAANSAFVCTELARAIWLEVGIDPLLAEDVALPAAFVKAFQEKRLNIKAIHGVIGESLGSLLPSTPEV